MEIEYFNDLKFERESIKSATKAALGYGFKVYTFKHRDNVVSQIFFEDDIGQIGSCGVNFSALNYCTVHKPCRSCGTGFMVLKDTYNIDKDTFDLCFATVPSWGISYAKDVNKWKSFEQKAKSCSVLTYYQIKKESKSC